MTFPTITRITAWALGASWCAVAGAQTADAIPVAATAGPSSAALASPAHRTGGASPLGLDVGAATRSLLAQQAQGAQASATQHSMPGPVAQQVYQRYVKSFAHPIPEHLGSALQTKK